MALVQPNFPAPGPALMETTVRMTTTTANGGSRLAQMQARFQQKQMQEKEQKLLRLYESQQQRAFQRVGATRGSAGNSSVSSMSSSTSSVSVGKVRQLFDERRTTGTTGWDRSYPLDPLDGSLNKSRAAAPPKSKAARVASLDRSQNNNQQASKPTVRRSKSHARGTAAAANNKHNTDIELNGSLRKQQNTVEVDYTGSLRKQTVEDINGSYRKQNNTEQFNGSFRIQPNNPEEDFNGSYRKPTLNSSDDFNGSFRKQELNNTHNIQQDYHEEEINYEHLGEDVPHLNGNQTFTIIDDKRQEDLFAKYQVRDVENNELLSASPPPELFNDELDDSYVFKKLPNVGGAPLVVETTAAVKNGDKFKTYNASKHKREERKKMSPPASEVKRGPARRESVSPPSRTTTKPAARKVEPKGSTPPPGARRPAPAAAPKQAASPPPRSTSAATMQRTAKKGGPAASQSQRAAPVPVPGQRQTASQQRAPMRPGAGAVSRDDLVECRVCKRRFATDRIDTHETICTRTGQKKRKEYDATKHRVMGTEAEGYVRRALKQGPAQRKKNNGMQKLTNDCPTQQPEAKKGDWRKKHEEFIQAIRAAKEAQAHVAAGGKLSDLPPPPPLDTSDYTQCPHCLRKFNDSAAERHIPRCATMQHNKPKPTAAAARGPAGSIRKR